MSTTKLSERYWFRYLLILILWLIIFGVSIAENGRLNDNIQSSTNIISTDTPAHQAADLINQRFNGTDNSLEQIVVLQLDKTNVNITDNQWQNYTLYLGLMLYQQMESKGYDSVLSYPIVLNQLSGLPNAQDVASSFVSKDHKTTLVFLSSTTLSIEKDDIAIKQHVADIRTLLQDYDKVVQTAIDSLKPFFGNDTTTTANYVNTILPSKSDVTDHLTKLLTGTAANIVDTLNVSDQSFHESEIIAGIVIITILILVFRTPLGVMIPFISTVAALLPAFLITSFIGESGLIVINSFLPAVIAMIGIAVAVDYNLFMLVRYREEFRKRRAEHENAGTWNKETIKETQVVSAQVMNKTAGSAVMYSGGTVAIGFAALFITENDFSVAMAAGVTVVVILSVFTARTLTPAILAFWGRFLDWPNFMTKATTHVEHYKKHELDLSGFWEKWANRVMKRPWTYLVLSILIMTPFVVLATQSQLSFSMTKSLPASTESRHGFEVIQDSFNLGDLNPYKIVIDMGSASNSIFNSQLITKVNDFAKDVLSYSGTYDGKVISFKSLTSLSTLKNTTNGDQIYMNLTQIQGIYAQPDAFVIGLGANNTPIISPNYLKLLFVSHSKTFINWEIANNTMIIDVTSNLDPGSGAAWSLVDVLRSKSDTYFSGLEKDGVIKSYAVTGFTALISESSDALYAKVPLMLTVAVVLIFIALMILFRSVILPAKAIITIAGSILFGLGTLVFIFQHGNFQHIELYGLTLWEAETSGITYFLPTFLFTTILGLGMDYSIFILSRVREEYEKSGEMGEAVGIGLARTAGVVTSAATIMTLTFLVFAASPMLTLKMMGLAMAIAIVVDATISRTIILPAAMKLAGKYNFWLPKWLDKILPKIDLEH